MPPLEGCRVLVVEDDYWLANDIADALSANGAHVVGPVGEFKEALEQVERGGFDVAVLDVNLHDRSVYPVADHLEQAAVPYLFATGYSAEVIPRRFRHVVRLEKPYDSRRLLQCVSQLCPPKAGNTAP